MATVSPHRRCHRPGHRWLWPALAALATSLVLTASPSAWADTARTTDPVGDQTGSRYSADPAPCGTDTPLDATAVPNVDITALVVHHTRSTVRVAVELNDLVPGRVSLTVPILTPRSDYTVEVDRDRGWIDVDLQPRLQSRLDRMREAHHGSCFSYVTDGTDSPGLRAVMSQSTDKIVVSVPRRSLGDPAWVRVGASTDAYRPDPDPHAIDSFQDFWAPAGRGARFEPYYGPRVRALPRRGR